MDDINQNSAGVSAGASINTNTNSDSSTQQADDFFAEYQNSIIAAMGLENLSPEDQKPLREKIATLVNQRLVNVLLINLPADKANEFKTVEDKEPAEVIEFLMASIPDAEDKIADELNEIKKDLVETDQK